MNALLALLIAHIARTHHDTQLHRTRCRYDYSRLHLQFKGLLWYCVDTSVAVKMEVLALDEAECMGADMQWQRNEFGSFDNIGSSMLLLAELSSLEQWPRTMYAAIEAPGVGLQPARDAFPMRAVFFVVFLLVGSFFVLSLFVGVVVDEYHYYHKKFEGNLISESQKEWLDTIRVMLVASRAVP